MPADLQLWHPDNLGAAKGKLLFRHVNMLNTPITSSAWNDGPAIADVYELIFTKVGAAVTATIEALIGGIKNPYHDTTSGRPVTADGSTPNTALIPGLNLVVSASVDTGWKARVAVGNFLDDDGSYEAFLAFGIVDSGTATAGVRVARKNVGDADAMSVVEYPLPGLYYHGTGFDTFIVKIAPHWNPARHDLAAAGTYTITFSDWKDAGGGKKSADVKVGGVVAIQDAIFDGSTIYGYGDGIGYDDGLDLLQGLQITLADTTADPTAVSITLVVLTDGAAYVEYAPDASGSPGVWAHQDLTLTESGQPSGTIRAGMAAYFHVRVNVPDAALAAAMRQVVTRARGKTV